MVPAKYIRKLLAGCICMVAIGSSLFSEAQLPRRQDNILFYQLNTANGLSDNYIQSMVVDKNGNLWVSTGEGLNMFNGKTVIKFFTEEYPQLQSDYTRQVVCDDNNRVWVMSQQGKITMIDENRKFHRIALYNKKDPVEARWMLQTKEQGIILFTREGFFSLSPSKKDPRADSLTNNNFIKIEVPGFDTLWEKGFTHIEPFDEESYIFSIEDGFFKVNFKGKKIEKKYLFPRLTILCRWRNDELLVYDKIRQGLRSVNLVTGQSSFPFQGMKDQFGDSVSTRITNARMIDKDRLCLATVKGGLYLYNSSTQKLYNYKHNAADPTTIVNNTPVNIATDNTGWVFVGATPNGISYFKNDAVIGQQTIFQDKQGRTYDGYINNLTTKDNDTYYIGVSDNLLEWKRSTNTTTFVKYGTVNGESLVNKEGISFVTFDNLGRLWIATGSHGVFVMDRNGKTIKHLTNDTTQKNSIPAKGISQLLQGPDGYMWLALRAGICRVNTTTFEIDRLNNTPFDSLKKVLCYRLFFADSGSVWVGTQTKGVWRYSFSTRQIVNYTKKNGLISNDVFCINKDGLNNIYVGTAEGLSILFTNGKIKTITEKEGLLNRRVEALLVDKNNRVWMGNDVGLACFNIADTSLRVFDESYGLSIQGFRVASYHQNSDDELVWGTERGLQYFYPDDLYNQTTSFKVNINRVETRKFVNDLTGPIALALSPSDNYITFYFSTIDFRTHLRTYYEYKLESLDRDWIKVIDQNFVRYSSLPPGDYIFKVRASNDNKTWIDAENTVSISIAKPLWQQWWFRLAGALLGIGIIAYVINYYRKKQQQKRNELETELVITYFASQINRHQKTDDLLWDVAKNCISKLRFVDCVIYLRDREKNSLVQKAAYGPKNPVDFTIHRPIEIPVGQGIVGNVAKTGKPELVGNTALDNRYIIDDEIRLSEIAVPVIIDGEVMGVIDSEHPQKNFFTQKHLQVLSTVAALCANQMQLTRAEEEKHKAEIELLENRQKATESRLQSLRLQMNPHFLFNALNSIQQMILANEDIVATKYLSRFSKLLRAILVHSDKETITLKEELEILSLYIELESIRFKESFIYTISVDEAIETEEIRIPTLLVQPFVENAIWHGLMHKEGDRVLKVAFTEENDFIQCVIEDNGIGRKKAGEMKITTGQGKTHTSKGIEVSKERLRTLQTKDGKEGTIMIIDLADTNGLPIGTRVEINFPIQN
ncbi:MAG: histidine kinase [Ferruginibacter sp.]|nr:histidine kinase [Chitinophagaceae bacterium]